MFSCTACFLLTATPQLPPQVLESGHILILGWSDKLMPIIKQLSLAHQTSQGGTVVVLADLDKDEMDTEVQRFIEHEMGDSSSLHVICRRGSPIVVKDLIKVSVRTAKSVIVLSEGQDEDTGDARALRIVLSLAGIRDKLGMVGHVVVEARACPNDWTYHCPFQLSACATRHTPIMRKMVVSGDSHNPPFSSASYASTSRR